MEQMLKETIEAVRMPQDMKQRITRRCQNRKEYKLMYINKRFAASVAVLVLCLGLPLGAMAAGKMGIMKDIKDWRGAITGQVYEHASDAIAVSAAMEGTSLLVTARFTTPEERPFRYVQELKVTEFEILDADERKLPIEKTVKYANVVNGGAVMKIPAESLTVGSYRLKITVFTADAKGEQPLDIKGSWECDFSIS